jgi:hypothetical protein
MSELLSYEKSEKGGKTIYHLKGVINEEADFAFMGEMPAGDIVINSAGVERINSCGVREWITALKTVDAGAKITYEECSAAFLDQVNMISNFIGSGEVKSMFVPYICEACDYKQEVLVDLATSLVDDELELPEPECKECSDPMELGDDPEQLFSFLE